jgi:putative hydrolase of the HAD superfamily
MNNKPIKENHISLDFWGTLVFSNINYRNERAKFLEVQLNKGKEQINLAYKEIGEKYNSFQEKGQNSTSPIELFYEVTEYLDINIDSINIENLYESVLEIFITNSPIINAKLKAIIDNSLADGKTISILSNTAFIPGTVIDKFLDDNFGSNYFSFKIFSDEVKIAKPNMEIFDLAYEKTKLIYPCGIKKNQILHIGDNYENDKIGAQKFGFNALLIKI